MTVASGGESKFKKNPFGARARSPIMPTVAIRVIDILSSSDDESDSESPSQYLADRKKKAGKSRRMEKEFDEDCYILDSDPESINFDRKLSLDDTIELAFIAEKGPVAVRDFPHSRHLCVKFPFATTPHEAHCDQVAPCTQWKVAGALPHCHATDKEGHWIIMRRKMSSKPSMPEAAASMIPVNNMPACGITKRASAAA